MNCTSGDGFIPAVLDVALVDEVIEVTDDDAIETTRQLSRDLGRLVGISSGANVWAPRQLSKRFRGNIVPFLGADSLVFKDGTRRVPTPSA